MDDFHKNKFTGVDTSHFHKPTEGETKIINGVTYVYLLITGKLRLVPVYAVVQDIVRASR